MVDIGGSLPLFSKIIDNRSYDRERNMVTAEFRCPGDFPAFKGHFPGEPILPAVMQLVLVRLLAGELLRTELDVVRTGRMKFKGMIKPDETVNIQVKLEKIEENWNAIFKLRKMDSVVATGSVLFRPGDKEK